MEKYQVKISRSAEKDLKLIRKSGHKGDIEKIAKIFFELSNHPRSGTGKPEQLKYFNGEVWSRKINKKDRLFYEIYESEILVVVIQTKGHYNDK